jgi:Cu(I)/Ag(I) efflux system membrane fusion protein
MKTVVLVLAVVSLASLSAADSIQRVVDPYLKIQMALATDTLDGVKPQAGVIAREADALGAQGTDIKAAARQIEQASDLKAAREAFGALTKAVMSYAEATKSGFGADVHEAYCPMARKSWLQKGEKIENPYYGKSMAGCGEIKKK